VIRLRFRKRGGGWVYATARTEAEARRMIAGLQQQGYEVERL
jgi:hypothetical protein